MPEIERKGTVTHLLQPKPANTGKDKPTKKIAQKATGALLRLHRVLGSWRAVEAETGINYATAAAQAAGRRPMNMDTVEKLGIRKRKRYYKNWRKKNLLLRRWIRRRMK